MTDPHTKALEDAAREIERHAYLGAGIGAGGMLVGVATWAGLHPGWAMLLAAGSVSIHAYLAWAAARSLSSKETDHA